MSRRALAALVLAGVGAGGLALSARTPPVARPVVVTAAVAPSAAPAPATVAAKPFDFAQLLPPPPPGIAATVPAPAPTAAAPADDDPYRTVGDRARLPALRNTDMERLRAGGEPRAIEVLLAIATDAGEDELMRSWAVQHLGLAWPQMDPAQRTRVRGTLATIVATPTPEDLPPREALLALAHSDHPAERALAIAAVDAGLGDDAQPRLDLLVRLAGELGLVRHRDRVATLTSHPRVGVSGAAREAGCRLAGERLP